MKFILKRQKIKKTDLLFSFVAYIKTPKRKQITAIGKVFGKISYNILEKKGFGYDPIFIPKSFDKTFGQIPKSKK